MDSRQTQPWSRPDSQARNRIQQARRDVSGALSFDILSNEHIKPVEYYELPGSYPTVSEDDAQQTSDESPKPSFSRISQKKSISKRTNSTSDAKSTVKSPNDIVIAVFGLTGTGKSSFISKLTGKDVNIGHGLTVLRNKFGNTLRGSDPHRVLPNLLRGTVNPVGRASSFTLYDTS